MQFVTEQEPALLAWAAARLRASYDPASCRWLTGITDEILFVVVYSHFSTRNCQLSIATDMSKRWATRRSLRAIFRPPFGEWGLRRVTFMVAADNRASLKMMSPLGATAEGRVRCAFDGDVDGILFGMLKEKCRWIG